MNKRFRKALMFMIFGFLFLTTGCNTSSFCTTKDKANIRNAYAEKITIAAVNYYENEYDLENEEKVALTSDYTVLFNETFLTHLEEKEYLSAINMNNLFEDEEFDDTFQELHKLTSYLYLTDAQKTEATEPTDLGSVAKYYNAHKALFENQQYYYLDADNKWTNPKTEYSTIQKELFTANPQACLTNTATEDVSGATIEGKTWGDAWDEGLLEGLFVYPISWLLYTFTNLIGSTGIGQVIAIFITTMLVRLLTVTFSLKSTVQAQKMQLLKPEMDKIQAKYAGRQNDPLAKQKMQQEMMKLYSKFKINPLTSLITPFLSMPIFFAMWGAVSRTAIIRKGSLFGLNMSTTLNIGIFRGNIFAIILFILMIIGQFCSMKLPQWIAKRKAGKKVRLEDPRTQNMPNQGKMMTNFFLVMIIVMGFMLPAAMSVYWIAGSVFAVVQTLLINRYTAKHENKGF